MKTIIISDLHLGNGGPYEAFAGAKELPDYLDHVAATPTHVFVNGDGVDFLMNEDPLELDRERAAQQARAIVAAPASKDAFEAFGRVLARGGSVTLRLGNHDIELALPEVQDILRGALGQPPEVAARLVFQKGHTPDRLDVGGAKILVTHGEHGDKWNKVQYENLDGDPERYEFTAGSRLVKQILNPLTSRYGLRFMNFLKPDFQGGTLTGLAVAPSMVKEIFKHTSLNIGWHLFKRVGMGVAFAEGEEDLGLQDAVTGAALSTEETAAFDALMSDDGPASFADDEEVPSWSVKIARAALTAYAGFQRTVSGTKGDDYFDLEPAAAEWKDATRLAKKFNTSAVIIGHTHAARWKESDGVVFANTGTWIWLMKLPSSDADDETWAEFITELRANPKLDPRKQKIARTHSFFTAVQLTPHTEGGATMALVRWHGDRLETLHETRLPGIES